MRLFQFEAQLPPEAIEKLQQFKQERKPGYLELKRKLQQVEELAGMAKKIEDMRARAEQVYGDLPPGIQADLELADLYPVPETDQDYQDLKQRFVKDLALLQNYVQGRRSLYKRESVNYNGAFWLSQVQGSDSPVSPVGAVPKGQRINTKKAPNVTKKLN